MKNLTSLLIIMTLQLHCGSVAASENTERLKEANLYSCPYGLEIYSKKDKKELKDIIIRGIGNYRQYLIKAVGDFPTQPTSYKKG